jgi:hypothetical protein
MHGEVLLRIAAFLDDRLSLTELESWLLGNLQAIHASRDPATIELAHEMDADLVQLGEGLIDLESLRQRWEANLKSHSISPTAR